MPKFISPDSGDADLGQVASRVSEVHIAGSGNTDIAPTDEAEIHIAGSGDVNLHANPKRLKPISPARAASITAIPAAEGANPWPQSSSPSPCWDFDLGGLHGRRSRHRRRQFRRRIGWPVRTTDRAVPGSTAPPRTSRELDWDGSDKVELVAFSDASYTPGAGTKLHASGDPQVLAHLQIRDGKIELDCRGWRDRDKIKLILPGREFRTFAIIGRSDLKLDRLNQSHMKAKIAGTGTIKANGRVDDLSIEVAGIGHADFGKVTGRSAKVELAGVSSADIAPTEFRQDRDRRAQHRQSAQQSQGSGHRDCRSRQAAQARPQRLTQGEFPWSINSPPSPSSVLPPRRSAWAPPPPSAGLLSAKVSEEFSMSGRAARR